MRSKHAQNLVSRENTRTLYSGAHMTASEYLFAATMTVLIVWLVAEVSGEDPFRL